MLRQALAITLTLTASGAWSTPEAAPATPATGHASWQRTDTRHFEIHYVPALAPELDRVVRSAERAYDRVSGRLGFVLARKVPLVLFAPSGPIARDEVVAYAVSDGVAPQHPHRSRIVLPLREGDTQLDALIVHELTHLLVCEIILPQASGDGGLPRWVHEGIASYMADGWSDDHERLMRELVAGGNVPALSRLSGDGAFADPRANDALGHAAFDYMEDRWGAGGLRRFVDGLIVPRVDRTYDAVFELTPAEFDLAFRQFAERRFGSSGQADRAATAKAGSSEPVFTPADALKWTDLDPTGAPGVKIVDLWGDHTKGAFGAYLRLPAGFAVPLHTHTHEMRVVFLSGTYIQAPEGKPETRLGPGSYMMQPGGDYRHTTACDKASECVFFVESSGPFDLKVVEAGKPAGRK